MFSEGRHRLILVSLLENQLISTNSKLIPFLEVVISSTSVFSIIAISIERFRVVCKPLSTAPYRLAPTIRTIFFIWFLSVVISVPMFMITVYKGTKMRDGTPIKVCRMPINSHWKRCYVVANYSFVYLIPVIVLFVLYLKVIKQLKASSANCLEFNDGYVCNQERHRIRRQVINIILCVVFVFFLCHLPFRVISLVLVFGNITKIREMSFENYLMLLYFSRCLLYANHALNPILYNFVSTKFRTAFKYLIFHGNRTESKEGKGRNNPAGVYYPTQHQRIIFKRKYKSSSVGKGGVISRDKESRSSSGKESRTACQKLIKDIEDQSRLNVAEEHIPCRWSGEYIRLEVKEKPSAKVRFILTPDGCVIGITLHNINYEDKKIQTQNH
ncbi:hypothetical protein FSP39_003680 [Pinctada imbricata]|uniref:G-protein coupled receptors family 1 profile domain-containing protein n=1 Tax=Pinctada imbricata TaxID=66713 RepID=A0AA88XHP4_PINIB|nr:hypothetical protein FSP39_003680 [Pinctada imbricata]